MVRNACEMALTDMGELGQYLTNKNHNELWNYVYNL